MRGKTAEMLERELNHHRQSLAKPGLSREWVRHHQAQVNALEVELARRRPKNSTVSARFATPESLPSAADAPERGYGVEPSSFLRMLPESRAPESTVDAEQVLPSGLLRAIQEEKVLYRPCLLKRVEDIEVDEEGLLSLVPHPAADPGWCGGSLFGFGADALLFAGEIVHMDASTGRIYVTRKQELFKASHSIEQIERWCYQPFDFSAAILAAASAYVSRSPLLQECLAGVHGSIVSSAPSAPATASGPNRLWSQRWGLLWGPPGTGKTETMANLLADAVRTRPGERILVVAPTNRAVDNLALRVARKLAALNALTNASGGAALFRGGVGVGEELSRAFPQLLHDTAYQALIAQVESRETQVRKLEARGAPAAQIAVEKAAVRRLRKGIVDETHYVAQRGDATLIFITLHRALRLVSELAASTHFARVIVDEAGMVTCAAAALLLPLGRKVTLAGDPRQIGPVCRVPEGGETEEHRWLRNSPLTHLAEASQAAGRPHVLFLRTQHRMHPDISTVVSGFSYSGMLEDGDGPRLRVPRLVPAFPRSRANWVVLDESVRDASRTAAERGESGRGYQRKSSAEVVVTLAREAIETGLRVLAVTPYRAQAELLRKEGTRMGFEVEQYMASTIHRQQGAEFDVVLVDTVAAGRPFRPADLTTMLNVAASRAREYLFVVASLAEAEAAIPGQLLRHLSRVAMPAKRGGPIRSLGGEPSLTEQALAPPDSLGSEIAAMRGARPLFTHEQMSLFERRIDEGHHLVRGVAGSGKTYVLAHWAARLLAEKPSARVLVSYFNKALAPLMTKLLQAAVSRSGGVGSAALQRIDIQHVGATLRCARESYDAVFVDEAQDMTAESLTHLHGLVKPVARQDGKPGRAFLLFMDDSQNVYGNKSIEDMKALLPDELNFAGRARVLREAFRSTRQILDLAFNVVLDPHQRHSVANPGMREFMRTQELKAQARLEEPADALDGLFHVTYTEREGGVPVVKRFESVSREAEWLVREVTRLIRQERVMPSDILIVTPMMPARWARALSDAGVRAVAYGGRDGQSTADFAVGSVPYVRATTIHSCKGHESPVVFFCGVDGLDDIGWMEGLKSRSPRELERTRRSMFYVGATRAMIRQYVSGKRASRFLEAASFYSSLLSTHPMELLMSRSGVTTRSAG